MSSSINIMDWCNNENWICSWIISYKIFSRLEIEECLTHPLLGSTAIALGSSSPELIRVFTWWPDLLATAISSSPSVSPINVVVNPVNCQAIWTFQTFIYNQLQHFLSQIDVPMVPWNKYINDFTTTDFIKHLIRKKKGKMQFIYSINEVCGMDMWQAHQVWQ